MTKSRSLPSYLSRFRTVLPQHRHSQNNALDWLHAAHCRSEKTNQERKQAVSTLDSAESFQKFERVLSMGLKRFGCTPPRIEQRLSELEDTTHQSWTEMDVFNLLENCSGSSMTKRMQVYSKVCDGVLQKLYPEGAEPPSLLLHVTCTGYVSPNPTQRLVALRGWERETESSQIYHMGCYAAIPAFRAGHMATVSGCYDSVEVVHNELCTLHFDPSEHSPEQLVVQSLFADGHIAYSMSACQPKERCFRVLSLLEEVIPDSVSLMTWVPSEVALKMTLAKEVPQVVAQNVSAFVERLGERAGLEGTEWLARCAAAVHPGGPRIIDGIQEVFGFNDAQVAASKAVLRTRGNMSSATLPHILENLLYAEPVPCSNGLVLCLAFGPGLTMAGAILELV